MKNILLQLIIALTFIPSLHAKDGGDSSGGGNLYLESSNPWFLSNISTVNYCVLIDEPNMKVTKKRVSKFIKDGFEFWKRQLIDLIWVYPEFKIGTQVFVETECDDRTDIRFQFGILNKFDREFLPDPREVVGQTVLTSYNKSEMRGRGFIYISPQTGPLAINHFDSIDEHMWERGGGGKLYLVLLHEMGHLFGIQHLGFENRLMGAKTPQSIISKDKFISPFESDPWALVFQNYNLISLFKNDLTTNQLATYQSFYSFYSHEYKMAEIFNFFEIEPTLKEGHVYTIKYSFDGHFLKVYEELQPQTEFPYPLPYPSPSYENFPLAPNERLLIGQAEVKMRNVNRYGDHNIIDLWIPIEGVELVKSLKGPESNGRIFTRFVGDNSIARANLIFKYSGIWKNERTKTERAIILTNENDSFTIGGIIDGVFYFDLRKGQ